MSFISCTKQQRSKEPKVNDLTICLQLLHSNIDKIFNSSHLGRGPNVELDERKSS